MHLIKRDMTKNKVVNERKCNSFFTSTSFMLAERTTAKIIIKDIIGFRKLKLHKQWTLQNIIKTEQQWGEAQNYYFFFCTQMF